ncbi:rRNA maturation RNase YbeY [Neolewinella xylanilytica]|uniref:Endoribonuclease YbeY n=1 Tax=Neolewinella xylanilytica TaxID=1514080 RepID=A0A2S6I6S7_9BACT|nr:rRNA maturation RNase YbeY [Neolewinella xylanilytica]PPK87188.1 rRNA maturation RNase YbeY [Neolewinella xylanilytica]
MEDWITRVISARGGELRELSYIFCDDDYLHQVNVAYLQHDTLTDIITFPYTDFPLVSGDLFISTERVRENAAEFGERYEDELHRVMIHGVLHLCGQSDKAEAEQEAMRELEAWALGLRPDSLRK